MVGLDPPRPDHGVGVAHHAGAGDAARRGRTWCPTRTEVERVFDVSLAELADPEIFHEERWRIAGRTIPGTDDDSFAVWFFEVSGELIWGATARMIHELLSIVLTQKTGF